MKFDDRVIGAECFPAAPPFSFCFARFENGLLTTIFLLRSVHALSILDGWNSCAEAKGSWWVLRASNPLKVAEKRPWWVRFPRASATLFPTPAAVKQHAPVQVSQGWITLAQAKAELKNGRR